MIIAFAFVFLTFAFSHEFGHFIVGKAAGVRVYEFSLGFGPGIYRFKRGETVYSLRLLPVGAFVKFAGLDEPIDPDDDVDDEDPRSFRSKPIYLRVLTILALSCNSLDLLFIFASKMLTYLYSTMTNAYFIEVWGECPKNI
jgi:regulator of sigma E protease